MSEETIDLTEEQLHAVEQIAKAQGTSVEKIIEKTAASFLPMGG